MASFHEKYRPTTLDTLIGHKAAVKILKAAVKSNEIPSAILITGVSSVGKTTLGRAFANDVMGVEDCTKTQDYMEINCTEDSRIDRMREVMQIARLKPTSKRRIMLLDESQGLLSNASAASSILKSIEEPASKTTWILCSMEPSKFVTDKNGKAIKNRCLNIELKAPERDDLMTYIKLISKGEGMKACMNLDLANAIIDNCGGEMRTVANLMQQVKLLHISDPDAEITVGDIENFCMKSVEEIDRHANDFLFAIYTGQFAKAQKIIMQALKAGAPFVSIAHEMCYANQFLVNAQVFDFKERTALAIWPSAAAKELEAKLTATKKEYDKEKVKFPVNLGSVVYVNSELIGLLDNIMRFNGVKPEFLFSQFAYKVITHLYPK